MNKFVRFLIPIAIAVVLGPLIAGLAVCVLAVASNILDQTGSLPLTDLFKMFGVYIVFAYLGGGVIAVIAGLLVSIWMIRRPPSLLVVIAAAAVATAVFMAAGALGVLGPVEFTNARSNFLFTLVLAVVAATGCWFLMRRYVSPA